MSGASWVTHHEGETLEDTYRVSDGDEYGYQVPAALAAELEAAQACLDAAVEAIREYIDQHGLVEQELDDEEGEG